MYSILHALHHLYINLYRVCTNAEMDKYPSFTNQLSQKNVGEMTDDLRIQEDNGDSGYKTDTSTTLSLTNN